MKITAADVIIVPVGAPEPPFVWRKGLPGSAGQGHGAVLLLRTDEGCDGVAFAPRHASSVILPDVMDRLVRDVLLGEDPFQRELLWHKIWELDRVEELPLYLLGVVDTALWDLAGEVGEPANLAITRRVPDRNPGLPSTTTFRSIEEYLEIVDQCIEVGYRAIKLHAFGDAAPTPSSALQFANTLATTSRSCTTGLPASTCRMPCTWAARAQRGGVHLVRRADKRVLGHVLQVVGRACPSPAPGRRNV